MTTTDNNVKKGNSFDLEFQGRHLLHKRLFLAVEDFRFSTYYLTYLLKHRLHNHPWERRWTVYQRQTAFTLALVVSYCKPFNGRSPLSEKILRSFTLKQKELHGKIMRLRNKIFAHSDPGEFAVKPSGGRAWIGSILSFPPYMIPRSELNMLNPMLKKLIRVTSKEQKVLERWLARNARADFNYDISPDSFFYQYYRAKLK